MTALRRAVDSEKLDDDMKTEEELTILVQLLESSRTDILAAREQVLDRPFRVKKKAH